MTTFFSDEDTQLKRLMARNNLTAEDAKLRISSQIPIAEKKSMVTNPFCLIDNNGPNTCTANQVSMLKQYLDKSWRPEIFRTCLLLTTAYLTKLIFSFI